MLAVSAGCGQDEAVSADAQAPETTEDAAAPDSTTEQVRQNTANGQPEMDEETRQQLMKELLEENEMDASVVESGHSTRGCTFDVPEGFEESQDVDNLYVTARYPIDASMIYYEVMDGDISLQLMTEEMFKEQAQESLRQTYGETIEINIDSYESMKIDGYPTFRILCHYEVEDIEVTQLEYVINADKTYVITYSQTSDYDWMEAFEASTATIGVK